MSALLGFAWIYASCAAWIYASAALATLASGMAIKMRYDPPWLSWRVLLLGGIAWPTFWAQAELATLLPLVAGTVLIAAASGVLLLVP